MFGKLFDNVVMRIFGIICDNFKDVLVLVKCLLRMCNMRGVLMLIKVVVVEFGGLIWFGIYNGY